MYLGGHHKLIPVLLVSTTATSLELHLLSQYWIACMWREGQSSSNSSVGKDLKCPSYTSQCSHNYLSSYTFDPSENHKLMRWLLNVILNSLGFNKCVTVCVMVYTSNDTGQGCDPSMRTVERCFICSSLIHWKGLLHLNTAESIQSQHIKKCTARFRWWPLPHSCTQT